MLARYRAEWVPLGLEPRRAVFQHGFAREGEVSSKVDARDPRWALLEVLTIGGGADSALFERPVITNVVRLKGASARDLSILSAGRGSLPRLTSLTLGRDMWFEVIRCLEAGCFPALEELIVRDGGLEATGLGKLLRAAPPTLHRFQQFIGHVPLQPFIDLSRQFPRVQIEGSAFEHVSTSSWLTFHRGEVGVGATDPQVWPRDRRHYVDRLRTELGLREVPLVSKGKRTVVDTRPEPEQGPADW